MSNYIAPDYEPTSAVSLFGNVPRFGHTDDLADLLTGESDYTDYAYGVVFIPCTILVGFLLWFTMIVIFKCCGRRVGLLSGHRLKDVKPHWFVRTVVMLSAAFGLAAGAMYLMKATTSLYDTFDSTRSSAHSLSNLAMDISNIANDLIEAGNSTKPIRDNLVQMMADGVCSSFDGGNGDPIDVDTQVQKAVDLLTDLSDFTGGELTSIHDNFSSQFEIIDEDVTNILDSAQDYSRVSYYAIGVISLSSIMYLGAYLAWFGPQQCLPMKGYFCLQTWIVVPLYFLTLIITAILTAAIGTALVVNSDLCTSGPENNPESLLEVVLNSTGISGMARESIDHFVVSGCASPFSGTDELDNLVINLEESLVVVSDLKDIIQGDTSAFETACGGSEGSLDPVLTALDVMKIAIASFTLIGHDGQNLLSCQGLNSIYIGLSHGSICRHMPETLAWMFFTMTIILLSGLNLFTFRAALLPDKRTHDDEDIMRGEEDEYDDEIKSIASNETPLPISQNPLHIPVDFDENSTVDMSENHLGRKEDDSIEQIEQEIEVSRLPTTDSDDIEIQISSRNLTEMEKESKKIE